MQSRIKLLQVFFLILFFLVTGKLFYWQIVKSKDLTILANQQYRGSKRTIAERGTIFTSDNFPLVLNQKIYRLYEEPKNLKIETKELMLKLESLIPKENLFLDDYENTSLVWVPLAKGIDAGVKNKIEELQIAGLVFDEEEKRSYPEASMSAQLLGFVADDGQGTKKGYFGLEGFYDSELRGKDGIIYFNQDALGRPAPFSVEQEEKSIPGRSITLNIDRSLQYLVEARLKSGINKYQASSGSVLVMNPKNGAILSMASYPNYDPSLYGQFDQNLYKNQVISSMFEPGSIFKVLVMAAALDTDAISKEEVCPCNGPRVVSGYMVKTWNEKYYPNSKMTDIIAHSDNVGMVYVSEKLGLDRFLDYYKKFGFTNKSGVDLQGEIVLPQREKNRWYDIDLATASFGQGIAITPVQFLKAVSAIANKGEIYQPQVVKKIFDDKKTIEILPLKEGQAISPKTASIVKEMMVEAVDKGEAKWAKPKGYQIAGKTGTAQIPIAGHYDPERTIASFVGFAPADDPAFVMLVSLTEPKSSPWGAETAAPLWFDIAKDIFRMWKIKPN